MSVVYPASLGLDEGICHLTMKGAISMLSLCGSGEGTCNHWALYAGTFLWVSASVATVWWLKIVFERYETTKALPIEYGTVNACSVCSGLIFYGERRTMEGWQVVLMFVGLFFILVGIFAGRPKALLEVSIRLGRTSPQGDASQGKPSLGA